MRYIYQGSGFKGCSRKRPTADPSLQILVNGEHLSGSTEVTFHSLNPSVNMSQAEDDAISKWDEFLVEGRTIIDEVVGGELLPARTARKIIAFRAEFQDPDLGIFHNTPAGTGDGVITHGQRGTNHPQVP